MPSDTLFAAYLSSSLGQGLVEHRFIQLAQYSVLRAYLANASILSLKPTVFLEDDALSPYTLFNPFPALSAHQNHSLAPTQTQLSTFHHPFIDLIASPSFRDNILKATLDDELDEMLCMDLHSTGFTVWGSQPWHPMGWEVSQEFANKWGWIMDEATVYYTNFWRAERGELPLTLTSLPLSQFGHA